MGGAVKAVGKTVGKVFGIDPSGQADAIRDAAAAQAAATERAAKEQAEATRIASAQQVQQVQQQSAASAAAQTASINQAAIANQMAEQAAQAPQEGTPDVQLGEGDGSNDPRRKYKGGGGTAIGGTTGGVGIRL